MGKEPLSLNALYLFVRIHISTIKYPVQFGRNLSVVYICVQKQRSFLSPFNKIYIYGTLPWRLPFTPHSLSIFLRPPSPFVSRYFPIVSLPSKLFPRLRFSRPLAIFPFHISASPLTVLSSTSVSYNDKHKVQTQTP